VKSWTESAWHRAWLTAETERLLAFAERSVHPDGGFAWLDVAGQPRLTAPVETWITCRMTHVYALGHLLGRPGSAALAAHGVAALRGRLHDAEEGGWFASVGPDGPVATDKRAYDQAFVILAASSASLAGIEGGDVLLSDALEVCEARFWRPDDELVVDVWDRTWSDAEAYRGANANMHMVEAWLAAADVTSDETWLLRALGAADQIVNHQARAHGWTVPEHYDSAWRTRPDYNADDRAHAFRPYGLTLGHSFEWARLCLHLHASLGDKAPAWLTEAAVGLFAEAVRLGWSIDGAPGFVYTVDWAGRPVINDRLHWVVCEAIAASAALHAVTGADEYETHYRSWWDDAAMRFIDREQGSWWHGLAPDGTPSTQVWDGKPDVYHAVQATLLPRLPLAPSLARGLHDGLLDAPRMSGTANGSEDRPRVPSQSHV
jgi:sulfoquinovose isomerase